MSYTVNFTASNKADFIVDFSAIDVDTDEAIDLTGAEVSIKIKEDDCYERYSATIGDGITQPSSTVLELTIPAATMMRLWPKSYRIGCVYSLNGETVQLFEGNFVVQDGIASL